MTNNDRHTAVEGRLTTALSQLRPSRRTVLWGTLLVNVELFMLLTYTSVTEGQLVLPIVYPLIWINAAVWVFARIRPTSSPPRRRLAAAVIGGAYFLVLLALTGHIDVGTAFVDRVPYTGLDVRLDNPPGMSPSIHYIGTYLSVQLIPYYVVGYASLSYLVGVLVLDVSRFALGGVLGLFSCISCTFPIVIGLFGGIVGISTTGVTAATGALDPAVSTAVFVTTVALLAWRPLLRE